MTTDIELLRCGYGYCFNNGECVNGSCVCGPEYSGSYCETSLCKYITSERVGMRMGIDMETKTQISLCK